MTDMYIPLDENPSITNFDPNVDLVITKPEQLGMVDESYDNFSAQTTEPANWFIFDPVDGSNTYWATGGNGSLINLVNPGGLLNRYKPHGKDSYLYADGGPRGLGHADIGETTWYRVNDYVGQQSVYGELTDFSTQSWKQGSIEFTVKPTKPNCKIVSGSLFPTKSSAEGTSGEPNTIRYNRPGVLSGVAVVPDGNDQIANALLEVLTGYSTTGLNTFNNGYTYDEDLQWYVTNNAAGVSLSDIQDLFRTFTVELVDGIIQISYKIHFGKTAKNIIINGKTNIIDGNWHHVIINRPSPFTIKSGDSKYGADGCIEIWVDGKLEVRSYEITTADSLPSPQILFNDSLNPAVLSWQEDFLVPIGEGSTKPWYNEALAPTNYVGGIRDYVYRQTTPLSPHQVNLNYTYAILNSQDSALIKVDSMLATALMKKPSYSSNKKKAIKLYWDSLVSDKTKSLNGVELDETFEVYSYSVSNKNIVSPTQTFNVDLNNSSSERFFIANVKTAIGKPVFISAPGSRRWSAQNGRQLDPLNEGTFISNNKNQTIPITNLLYGGVTLNSGDSVLLFNQAKATNNGVWIFNGPGVAMTRSTSVAANKLKYAHVYINEGKHAGKTFIQLNEISHLRNDPQLWSEVDSSSSTAVNEAYPVNAGIYSDDLGKQRFIDINTDIDVEYDVITFMNYPTESKDINAAIKTLTDNEISEQYKVFIESLKTAVENGKSIFISSPMLAVDFGVVDSYVDVDQLLDESGDAQSAAISPFEFDEPAENYFDTHRNIKYHLATEVAGLTDKETYIMSDIVTYSPNRIDSDYHIKYNYRQFGLQEGDEFIIPGLTTAPETLNTSLPGYLYNQRGIGPLSVFEANKINFGTAVTKFANLIYDGSTAVNNPNDDYISTIAGEYGDGKIFVNCVENGYAFSRSDYNTARIQNVTAGQNSETVQTAAWQYSTKRLNKKNFYDFSDTSNLIGQTTPTDGAGGALIQAQSHCSNGIIRKNTDKGNLKYQSDLYADFTEEVFETTEIPVLSMTWLGLQWLAE